MVVVDPGYPPRLLAVESGYPPRLLAVGDPGYPRLLVGDPGYSRRLVVEQGYPPRLLVTVDGAAVQLFSDNSPGQVSSTQTTTISRPYRGSVQDSSIFREEHSTRK